MSSSSRGAGETRRIQEEVGAQAVYSLLGLLHSAQEIARLLPDEPAAIRKNVMEALAVTEIAVLRFKMELPAPPTREDIDVDLH